MGNTRRSTAARDKWSRKQRATPNNRDTGRRGEVGKRAVEVEVAGGWRCGKARHKERDAEAFQEEVTIKKQAYEKVGERAGEQVIMRVRKHKGEMEWKKKKMGGCVCGG